MADITVGSIKVEVDHIKSDIVDIKINAKEQGIAMLGMRDSNTETRIYINQIRESQNTMARETKETIALVALEAKENQKNLTKEAKSNQESTLEAIKTLSTTVQTMKDEPQNSWKKMSLAWKIGAGAFVITWVLGNLLGLIKTFM